MQVALYDYGLTPDSSSVSVVVREDGSGDVELWSETFCPEGRIVARISEANSWRELVSVLYSLDEGGVDPDAFDFISVDGVSGLPALALRCAWSSDRSDEARWLASQTDRDLQSYEVWISDAIRDEEPGYLADLTSMAEELIGTSKMSAVFNEFGNHGDSIPSPRELLDVIELRFSEFRAEQSRAREKKLQPFADNIDSISEHFDDRRIRGGGMSVPSARARVKVWLQNYCIEHQRFPCGTHEVSIPFMGRGRLDVGRINFDDFCQLDANQSASEEGDV